MHEWKHLFFFLTIEGEMVLGWVLGIVALATLGQSIMGFGGGLIAIPLLSLVLSVKDAVVLGLVMQVLVGTLALRSWRSLSWPLLLPIILPMLPATWLGTYLLGAVDESILRRCLAGFILLFLARSVFWPNARLLPSTGRFWAGLSGVLAGLLQGMIGTGGPPLVIYLSEAVKQKHVMRTSLLFVLMISNVMRVFSVTSTGMLHPRLNYMIMWVIPFVLTAMWVGQRLHHKVREQLYQRAVWVLLLGSSISLLLKS